MLEASPPGGTDAVLSKRWSGLSYDQGPMMVHRFQALLTCNSAILVDRLLQVYFGSIRLPVIVDDGW